MPFSVNDVYEIAIKNACEQLNCIVLRADEIIEPGNIIKDIIVNIEASNFIIADLTSQNPNVFYELGVAHSLGKKVIMISEELEDVPFDLRPYRILLYKNNYSGINKLESDLKEAINYLLINFHKTKPSNPVIDYLERNTQTTSEVDKSIISKSEANKIRKLLLRIELITHEPVQFSFNHITRIKELINLSAEIAGHKTAYLLKIIDEYVNSNYQPKETKTLYQTLIDIIIAGKSDSIKKHLQNLDTKFWWLVYDFMKELMSPIDFRTHGWHVGVLINEVIADRKEKGSIESLVYFLAKDPNPFKSSWSKSLLETGSTVLGRVNFIKFASTELGYDYASQLNKWEIQHNEIYRKNN